MVAATIRTIFAQPKPDAVRSTSTTVAGMLEGSSRPSRPAARRQGRPDRLRGLPARALDKIWSTNPLERLNREVKRRTDVVGIFPNTRRAAAPVRLRPDRGARRMAGQRPALPVEAPWRCSTHRPPPSWNHDPGPTNTPLDQPALAAG
jgi:putative transposase